MQDSDNTSVIYPRQPVQFLHHGNTFRFIICPLYQVRNSVNHHHVNPPVLIMELIHALDNRLQTLFAAHSRKAIRFQIFRHRFPSATPQKVRDILVRLHLRLFRIIEQNCLPLAVLTDRHPQRIHCLILVRLPDSPRNQCRHIITFPGSFATGNTKDISLRT